MVRYKQPAWAPSIFRALSLGWWAVTHSLADDGFHVHRPTVKEKEHLLWCLDERVFERFILTIGASHIARPAYQERPTNVYRFKARAFIMQRPYRTHLKFENKQRLIKPQIF